MRDIDVAIAIIRRDGMVLVCQRKAGDSFGGLWEFPGGKFEPGETAEQCLARELREELAVAAPPIDRLATLTHVYPNARLRLHPFICDLLDGDPQPLECQQMQWIAPTELRRYSFPPANGPIVAEVIAYFAAEPDRRQDIPGAPV